MNRKSKVLVFSLVISMACVNLNSTKVNAQEGSEVNKLISLNLMDGELGINSGHPITREEFCYSIVKTYEELTGEEVEGRVTFKDKVSPSVEKAAYLGIVSGISNDEFKPNGELNREQAAVIIDRLIQSLKLDMEGKETMKFIDEEEFSDWARDSIFRVSRIGIMQGIGSNNFKPKFKYTIEHSATTILRVYDKFFEENKPLDEEEISKSILSLKSEYYEGRKWDNKDFREWKGGIYSGGYGCAGFAFMASDKAFGEADSRLHYDFNDIKVGDIVRINKDSHSLIVIGREGEDYTFAEGNRGGKIHWGRVMSLKELKSVVDYVITRYPLQEQ